VRGTDTQKEGGLDGVIATGARRGPESALWSATLGGLLLGGAMLYHASVNGVAYSNATRLSVIYAGSVTLSPVQIAVLILVGIGSLAFAGLIRIDSRPHLVHRGVVASELTSIGYIVLLSAFFGAGTKYPLVHSYRASILASVLFGIALVSTFSDGTWREPEGLQRIIVGPDRQRLVQWGTASGVLLAVAAGGVVLGLLPYWAHTPLEAIEVLGNRPVSATVVILGWAFFVSLSGYFRSGLLTSWLLVAGPVSGSTVALSVTDQPILYEFELLSSPVASAWAFTTDVAKVALVVGTVGYLLGAVTRHIERATS